MADVVRSAGAANLMNSAAAINVETARSAYLDNQIKFTNTYFEKKRIRQSYVDSTKDLSAIAASGWPPWLDPRRRCR